MSAKGDCDVQNNFQDPASRGFRFGGLLLMAAKRVNRPDGRPSGDRGFYS
jgi:hypothetical protein